jgi:hypothetical protein
LTAVSAAREHAELAIGTVLAQEPLAERHPQQQEL